MATTGNDFAERYDTADEQEYDVNNNYDYPAQSEECSGGLLPCDGTGTGSDNPCPPGSSLRCVEDCPPGYVLGCCEIIDDMYPPGNPAVQQCAIYDQTNLYGMANACHKLIDGKHWVDNQGEHGSIIEIQGDQLEVVKSFGNVPVDQYLPGWSSPATNHRVYDVCYMAPDRVFITSGLHNNAITYPKMIVAIYDTDGNYLDYFEGPDNLNSQVYSPGVADSDGQFFYMIGQGSTPGGSVGYLLKYDYYGTLVDQKTMTYSTIGTRLALVGDKLVTSGYEVEPQMWSTDFDFIKTLSRGTHPSNNKYFGNYGCCVLKTPNKPDLFYFMNATKRFEDTYNSNGQYTIVNLYNENGDVLYEFQQSETVSVADVGYFISWSSHRQFRFGDIMTAGLEYAYKAGDNQYAGTTLLYDLETGEITQDLYTTQPYPGNNAMFCLFAFMDKNWVWSVAGRSGTPATVKRCKVNW